MARFGRDSEAPFIELNKILKDIFISAHMLGTYYWPRQGRVGMEGEEFKKHLDKMHKQESVFWFQGEEHDKIGPRVENVIKQIENMTKATISEKDIWFKELFKKG
jgi:hypothetical protein